MSIALMTAVWKLDMSPTDKMVLLALADAANDDGVCWTPIRSRKGDKLDLLKKCSLSERAIQGSVKRLCDAGHLHRVERPGRGVIYNVTPAADAPRTKCAPQHLPPAGNDTDPRTSCGETVSNPNTTSEAKASSVVRVQAIAPDFARFWAAYPNKVGKDPARKAFDRAVKRCDVEVMLAAIEQQRTWDQWQRGFVPHAATWLNNGRWQDEPPPTPVISPNAGRQNVPGPDAKQSAHEANNARAFAGAEEASRWRTER